LRLVLARAPRMHAHRAARLRRGVERRPRCAPQRRWGRVTRVPGTRTPAWMAARISAPPSSSATGSTTTAIRPSFRSACARLAIADLGDAEVEKLRHSLAVLVDGED